MYAWLSAIVVLYCSLSACSPNQASRSEIRRLDSLTIVLSQAEAALNSMDTALINRCVKRYSIYRAFISANVSDTLSKDEAINVNMFMESGNSLSAIQYNSANLKQRIGLVNDRLTKFRSDLINNTVKPEDARPAFSAEYEQVNVLNVNVKQQEKIYMQSIEQQKQSLADVEKMIRKHNQSQLPLVIENETQL